MDSTKIDRINTLHHKDVYKRQLHYLGNGNKRADFVGNVRACLKNHSRSLQAPVCGIFHLNSVAVRQYIVNPI